MVCISGAPLLKEDGFVIMLNIKKLSVSVNLASASGRCLTGRPSLPTSGLSSLPPSPKHSQTQAQRCTLIHSHSHTRKYLHAHTLARCTHVQHSCMPRVAQSQACTRVCLHTRCRPSLSCLLPFTLALLPHLSSHFAFSVFPSFLLSPSLSPSLRPCISDSLCLSLFLALSRCSPALACISFLGPNYLPTQDPPCLGIH